MILKSRHIIADKSLLGNCGKLWPVSKSAMLRAVPAIFAGLLIKIQDR